MKRILLVLLAVALFSAGSAVSFAADKPSSTKLIAYYFHGNSRCPTCHKLEHYSKEVIEDNFKDKLASGELVFNVINTDKKGNEHFVSDYQLYTKSLVISLVKEGKEVKSKNLVKIWDYVGNRQKFFDYVTSEINNFLKGS